MSPGRSRRAQPGLFLVIVGPDGTGKTTLAAELTRIHGDPTMYIHFRPSMVIRPDSRPSLEAEHAPKRDTPGPAPLGWVRIAASLVAFWIGYLRWVRPELRKGSLVVGDRWIYGYVAQPAALGFAGPEFLARWICARAPRPDLVVRLTAPGEEIHRRKSDLTLEEIAAEERVWETVAQVDLVLDALSEPAANARKILDQIHVKG